MAQSPIARRRVIQQPPSRSRKVLPPLGIVILHVESEAMGEDEWRHNDAIASDLRNMMRIECFVFVTSVDLVEKKNKLTVFCEFTSDSGRSFSQVRKTKASSVGEVV